MNYTRSIDEMGNSDYMAEAMRRESELEALTDLKEVLEKHDLELITDYDSFKLRIVQGNRNTIRLIHTGKLDAGNILHE